MNVSFNVILTSEPPWYVAKCPDNNVASQGRTVEEALANLKEALELYYEDGELPPRTLPPVFLTTLELTLP
jgi:predicted RNase H-like HicB family nuclease